MIKSNSIPKQTGHPEADCQKNIIPPTCLQPCLLGFLTRTCYGTNSANCWVGMYSIFSILKKNYVFVGIAMTKYHFPHRANNARFCWLVWKAVSFLDIDYVSIHRDCWDMSHMKAVFELILYAIVRMKT